MSAPRYWPPQALATGTPAYQPKPPKLRAAWQMRNGHFQETGFIDAPGHVPAGATRAADAGRPTLGEGHVPREGA